MNETESEDAGKFVLKGKRYESPVQESCDSVEDAVSLACQWMEPCGSLQIGWAWPNAIEDSSGQVVVIERDLQERIAKRAWW